jgi:signal transduction histidine kinase/FixJ family two-component response regulator/PAS domain-containing protein
MTPLVGSERMRDVLAWLQDTVAGVPLPVLEVWGRLSYLIGFALAVLAFGGFTFRLGDDFRFGRERQAWDAKALWAMPFTFIAITVTGYIGSFIVLVPGAQTFEAFKDLTVFLCVVLLGYPALITVPFAYGLADLIEGVPPGFLWGWLPGYLMNPACFWIAYQLIGKSPDFRTGTVWLRYGVFVLLFVAIEPMLWGFVCSDRFTSPLSYHQITSALLLTTAVTWLMAPFAMMVALPIARKFKLFWAEIPGHVRERAWGQSAGSWETGTGDVSGRINAAPQGLPLRMVIFMPFVALVLLMVAATGYVTLRSAGQGAHQLAERLHQEIARNIHSKLAQQLEGREVATIDLEQVLNGLMSASQGRAVVVHRGGAVAPATSADDPIVHSAIAALRTKLDGAPMPQAGLHLSFDHLSTQPLSRETWLAYAAEYRDARGRSDWTILTVIPEAFYLSGVRAGNSRFAMVFAVGLLLSLVVAAILASVVTTPMRTLSRATAELARGNLATQVPLSALSELRALSESFNQMSRQLATSFETLTFEVERRKHREKELEQSEERLKVSENRVQLGMRAAKLALWEWDVERDELLWDEAMFELYGLEKKHVKGTFEVWERCVLAEDLPLAKRELDAALGGEKDFDAEFRIRLPDGSVRFIKGAALVIRGSDRRPQRMVGVNLDVTATHRLESERQQLVRDLGERVKELRLLHSASRLLQRARPFDRALLSDLVELLPKAWQYPECCEARIGYLGMEVATAGFFESDVRQLKTFSTSDGTGFVEVMYTQTRAAADEGPFLTEERAALESLTEMLVAYLELTKYQAGLEALVRERTAALVAAKDEAEAASRAKTTFLATMSHEIRTPMNAILGFGQLMQRESTLNARDAERVDKLLRNGYHLLEIINNVLEMSKIEAGRAEAIGSSFDLHRTLRDVEAMMLERFETKGVAFRMVGLERLVQFVHADAAKLRQILLNLLSNAAKFTFQGHVTLSAESRVDENGVTLTFRVRDTGVGMRPEEMEKAFQPFSQTSSGLRSQTGTGLGLTISRDFARLMGGDLRALAEPGGGTTFELVVRAQVGTKVEATAPLGGGQVVGLAPGHSVPTVLVVDDERDNRAVLTGLLDSIGVHTLEAAAGDEAVRHVTEQRPDLVFMDVKMPVMDGIEATRLIRALEVGRVIPIIMLSASVFQDERQSVLRTGGNEFMGKPFQNHEIWDVLERHLGLTFVRGPVSRRSNVDSPSLTREQVAALGDEVVRRIREALELGFIARIPQILTDVPPQHKGVAAAISRLATDLEIQRLESLV